MNYMTVKDAAKKWSIGERQVQLLCKNAKIPGVVCFNRSFAIPVNAQKPIDGRYKKDLKQGSGNPYSQPLSGQNAEIFKEILDKLPYRVTVSDADGIMVYANNMFMEGVFEDAGKTAIGSYNIKNEDNLEKWQLSEHIKRAFEGELTHTVDVEFPNRMLVGKYYGKNYAFMSLYNDITSFPLFNRTGQLSYVVTIFIPVRKLNERNETLKARSYIEEHWREPFDAAKIAKASGLSSTRLRHIFREDVGFSPRDYYREVKLNRIREKLLDVNLSVTQAFSACGLDYNSYYASLFKQFTGMTPMEYRKIHIHTL